MQTQHRKLKILSFDPSITNWGIAAALYDTETEFFEIKYLSTISPISDHQKNKRDVDIASQLITRLDPLIKQADIICVEVPTGSQGFRPAVNYAMCCALIGVISTYGIPVIHVTPYDVKKVVGENASKKDVVHWVVETHKEAKVDHYKGLPNVTKANHYCDAVVVMHASVDKPDFIKAVEELLWKSV